MFNVLDKVYSVKHMVKQKDICGDIPDTKSVYRKAIDMAWPSAAESALVALVVAVDTMMVGTLGEEAIAAVGITGQPKFVLLSLVISLNVGTTAIVARRKGAQDSEGANRCLRQALMLCLVISIIMSIIGFNFARPILQLVGAQPDFIDQAVTYFKIISIANFFSSISLTINAAQRGSGNTRISMRTNIAANLVNVTFNYLLISGNFGFPRLEIAGAAIATLLGNMVAFGMSLRSILRDGGYLQVKQQQEWKLHKSDLNTIKSISSSSLLEQLCIRVGFILTTFFIANLETTAYATHQICMNLVIFTFALGDGLGVGASALVGQGLGAKRPDMSMIYSKSIQRIAMTGGIIFMTIFISLRYTLIGLFTDEAAIIATGGSIVIILALMSPVQAVGVVIGGTLRGAGDTRFVAYGSLLSIGVVRPLSTWFLCYPMGLGVYGAWLAFMLDQILRLTINSWRFRTGKWTRIKIS